MQDGSLSNMDLSAFCVNVKGQLCIPNFDFKEQIFIFNVILCEAGEIYFGFSKEDISPGKDW